VAHGAGWRGERMQTVIIGTAAAAMAIFLVLAWRWVRLLGEVAGGLEALRRGSRAHVVRAATSWPIGRLVRVFNAAAADVSGRIARLEQDRQQLIVVLEAMAEAVIAVDIRNRLLFANAGANRLFGLDPASVGRLIPELIRSPQVQDAIEATLRLTAPQSYQTELALASRDGTTRSQGLVRHLAVRGTPLPGSPSPGAVLVFHDVTDLRRLERMRQDFVANASHELKTPLASIKAYTETLLDWGLHDDTVNVRFLERIDEQAERLNQLILDLLSLARLESGQDVFDHQPLDVIPVLEACVEGHRGRAAARNLVLSFDHGGLVDGPMILADEEAVRQIADNLIDNAIKYTPENGSVRVHCYVVDDMVVFDVCDTGIGIPRDDLPRIFERFYRVDKARSRELGGTGLGLSIVKHLVQSIGGRVDVTSRVGSGSQFTVRVPRCRPTDTIRPNAIKSIMDGST
jgi:two-component system, OmpR family, phosphate regulon sensor histidine kinase PhoR